MQTVVVPMPWLMLILELLFCLWGLREIARNKHEPLETRLLGLVIGIPTLLILFVLSAYLTALQENFSNGTFCC